MSPLTYYFTTIFQVRVSDNLQASTPAPRWKPACDRRNLLTNLTAIYHRPADSWVYQRCLVRLTWVCWTSLQLLCNHLHSSYNVQLLVSSLQQEPCSTICLSLVSTNYPAIGEIVLSFVPVPIGCLSHSILTLRTMQHQENMWLSGLRSGQAWQALISRYAAKHTCLMITVVSRWRAFRIHRANLPHWYFASVLLSYAHV